MNVADLVDNYFDQITVNHTDYVPVDDAKHDASSVTLEIPVAMVRGYMEIEGLESLPDPVEFWEKTGLCERLSGSGKPVLRQHEHLDDMLETLGGNVDARFYNNLGKLGEDGKITFGVTEVPEFYDD